MTADVNDSFFKIRRFVVGLNGVAKSLDEEDLSYADEITEPNIRVPDSLRHDYFNRISESKKTDGDEGTRNDEVRSADFEPDGLKEPH